PALAPPRPHTPSLHDALPISSPADRGGTRARSRHALLPLDRPGPRPRQPCGDGPVRGPPPRPPAPVPARAPAAEARRLGAAARRDRKSTRLNSSHVSISYAVF